MLEALDGRAEVEAEDIVLCGDEGTTSGTASANAGANTAVTQESIRQLNQTLDDTKITAPVSGTVTAVYASVGSSGSGLLFVIEDTEHLVVSTSVKGYDLGDVKTGMTVENMAAEAVRLLNK